MSYELRRYAREHFSNIAKRKEREHEAEIHLVRLYLGEAAGVFVDVGANEPKRHSQTWLLEQHGWSGLLIEPVPELCEILRKERPRSTVIQAACGASENCGKRSFIVAKNLLHSSLTNDQIDFIPAAARVDTVDVFTLDQMIETASLPRVDFVSIDVEGGQLDVLRGFSLDRHRPRLLLIEDHLIHFETHRYMTARGYRLVKRTGLNNWYIPDGSAFMLTDGRERFALWRKMWLRTPVRRLRAALRRKLGGA